jgi:GT2 family glycosyltransferase
MSVREAARPANIAVAAITHGRRECVRRMLESVERLDPAPARVVCCVQEDVDDTVEMINDLFPFVELLVAERNGGVWPGMNAVYRALWGGGRFASLPINDADLVGSIVRHAARTAAGSGTSAGEIDVIAMIDDDAWFLQTDAIGQISDAFARWPGVGVLQARLVETGRLDEGDDPYLRAEWTGGANAMRRAVWDAAGPYPDRFVRSAGETVMAARALAAGFDCAYLPGWRLAHQPDHSARNLTHFHDYSVRNRYLASLLIDPPGRWLVYWCGHFARSVGRAMRGARARPLHALAGALRLAPVAVRSRTALSHTSLAEMRRRRGGRLAPTAPTPGGSDRIA